MISVGNLPLRALFRSALSASPRSKVRADGLDVARFLKRPWAPIAESDAEARLKKNAPAGAAATGVTTSCEETVHINVVPTTPGLGLPASAT